MNRRLLVVALALVALALGGGIARGGLAPNSERPSQSDAPSTCCVAGATKASASDTSSQRTRTLSRREYQRLQDRVNQRDRALARQGVYVLSHGGADRPCYRVDLANPTRPNIEFVRRQFGPRVCVSRRPGRLAYLCTGYTQPRLGTGPVAVPDLGDLGLRDATRRALAVGLTYSVDCPGAAGTRILRPRRNWPDELVRITKQCPAPGELVPPGTEVALAGTATLPGGFKWEVGALTRKDPRVSKPCADGRHATPPQ